MSEPVLLREDHGGVAVLTLNRPRQINALDSALRDALREMVMRLESEDHIRIVILKGQGRGFCAGADLTNGFEAPVSKHLEHEYKPALTGISDSSKLWIAQVHGSAAGIGAAFAMNCDLITMADTATIYMAFAAIAIIPDGGNTHLLLSKMGYQRALQAVLEGERISAEECLRWGLVNKVVPQDDLETTTMKWAQKLAATSPLAMAAAKRLLRKVGAMGYGDAISAEAQEQDALVASDDFKIGVSAFFAKEKPAFTGK